VKQTNHLTIKLQSNNKGLFYSLTKYIPTYFHVMRMGLKNYDSPVLEILMIFAVQQYVLEIKLFFIERQFSYM